MKKLQTPLFLIFIGILFCAASCKKEQPDPPPDLPPLTNVGAMTFGCYVNGEPWVAEVPPFIPTEVHLAASINTINNRVIIYARKNINSPRILQEIYIKFDFYNVDSIMGNQFNLINNNQNFIDGTYCAGELGVRKFKLDTLYANNIEITYIDINKRYLSGKFEFTAIDSICNDTVSITNGRFDTVYSLIE